MTPSPFHPLALRGVGLAFALFLLSIPAWSARRESAQEGQEPSHHQEPAHHTEGDHMEGHHGAGMHHDFSDAEAYAKSFDSPERLAWQKPDEVVALLEMEPGMTVVDLGAGTGFFMPYLAAAVESQGRVLELDVEENMVTYLAERAKSEGLGQVEARKVPYDDPQLEAGSVDRILIVDTWHHIDDRPLYSAKLKEALAPGGRIMVVDFERSSPHGPPPQHRLEASQVIEELDAGGLHAEQLEETLPNQYIVVARP